MSKQLRINEIFFSLQGETRTVGIPTVFVRLTGCPLRCGYCDTEYAFYEGKSIAINEISEQVASYKAKYVTVTGGEPLAQKNCLDLLTQLCDADYIVSLETSGAIDISEVDKRVIKVMDIKTPDSNEVTKNRFDNIQYLTAHDQIKFVICNRDDYEWAKKVIEDYQLLSVCEILFSPSFGQLNNQDLAEWILADRLPVRFQLQMHKYVWGEVRGH